MANEPRVGVGDFGPWPATVDPPMQCAHCAATARVRLLLQTIWDALLKSAGTFSVIYTVTFLVLQIIFAILELADCFPVESECIWDDSLVVRQMQRDYQHAQAVSRLPNKRRSRLSSFSPETPAVSPEPVPTPEEKAEAQNIDLGGKAVSKTFTADWASVSDGTRLR